MFSDSVCIAYLTGIPYYLIWKLTPCSRNLLEKAHYHVHKSPPLVPLLSYMHPLHTFPPYFLRIHSNIILPSTSTSSKWPLPFRSFICISHLSYACCMPHPSQPPWLYYPSNIRWSVQVMQLLIMQSSLASCPFLPLRSKYSPQHPLFKHPQPMLLP